MIGILDVGRTKTLASTSTDGAALGPVIRRPTDQDDPIGALGDLLDVVREGRPLQAVTLSVPGPFDRKRAALLDPPGLGERWRNLDLRAGLGERFGCAVLAENDANCSAIAEATAGAGRGHDTVVYYTVSTGIGTGVVRNGRLDIHRDDTEGGHQVLWPGWLGGPECPCGGHGCLEVLASGRALHRRFGVRAEELVDHDAWEDAGRWYGLAVVNTTLLLDPDVVIFGGGVAAAWDRFATSMLRTVAENLHLRPAPHVVRAELVDGRNNLVGALANHRSSGANA